MRTVHTQLHKVRSGRPGDPNSRASDLKEVLFSNFFNVEVLVGGPELRNES